MAAKPPPLPNARVARAGAHLLVAPLPPPPPDPRVRADSEPTRICRAQAERIYVKRNWYLRVDPDGYIEGNYGEGAFGCVVPMYSAADEGEDVKQQLALKIPRLLADSVRENEFIRQIVETEARLVAKANRDVSHASGLIPTQEIDADILRGVRELRGCDDAVRRAQDGCVLLFSFQKNRAPRVVAVKHDERGELVVFPRRAQRDVSFITMEIWEELRDPNRAKDERVETLQRNFREPYYFELIPRRQQIEGGMRRGPTSWTMSTEGQSTVWYCGLPSIIYRWATGTLQEAVSLRAHRNWRLAEHYDLLLQILRGVRTLHDKGLIHGDLRPANIMTMGAQDSPGEYAVGDYGSFSVERSRNGPAPATSGHTMTGAGVSRHRTSMFYAPERRIGFERETADVAVVIDSDVASPYYLVALGWKSQLLDDHGLRPELAAQMENEWEEMLLRVDEPTYAGHDPVLRNGDRLRLREYVFEVRASKTTPMYMLILGDRRYAQVLHERVAVYSHDDQILPNGLQITLPMYTEIHQWSAATDLYGVGTLALYTLFMTAVQPPVAPEGVDKSVTARHESMIAELIQRLGSVADLAEIWPDLDLFWAQAEGWTAAVSEPEQQVATGLDMRLLEFAIKTVNTLLRIKNMKFILGCFSADMVTPRDGLARPHADATEEPTYNLAHFLFFIHFVVSCIHRRRSLEAVDDTRRYVDATKLLCIDRCERPQRPDGTSAAGEALERLITLQRRLNSPIYRGFLVAQSGLDFDYLPESELQLQRHCKELTAKIEARDAALWEMHARVQHVERARADEHQLIDELARRVMPAFHVREFLRRIRGLTHGRPRATTKGSRQSGSARGAR